MLTELFRRKRTEQRAESVNLGNPRDPALLRVFGLAPATTSGMDVSEETAANVAAVFCAVRCISETAAMLPLYAYQRRGEDRQRMPDHPASMVLRNPNDTQTRIVFREMALADCLLWGNFYAELVFREARPAELWRIHPSKVQQVMDGRRISSYTVREDGKEKREILPRRMIHVPSPMGGRSVVGYARESLGLTLAAEQMGAGVFGNGGKVGGVLTLTRPATTERKIEIAEEWKKNFGGPSNQGKIAVLDPDSSYTQIGIPPEDAQFLQTRLFQVQEVARWFRLSPTKLMDFSHATFSNIEEVNRQFAHESILPWTKRFDQEYDRKLLTPTERETMFVEHDLAGLLEGDIESQGQFWALGRQWGWISANEIRRKLNMNGIGPDGDIYLQPMNMVDAGDVADEPGADSTVDDEPPEETPPAADEPAPDSDSEAVRELREHVLQLMAWVAEYNATSQLRQVQAIAGKFAHKESRDVQQAAEKPAKFLEWLDGFYGRHADKLAAALGGIGYQCRRRVDALCEDHRRRLVDATDCQPDELGGSVQAVLDTFDAELDDFIKGVCDAG